MRRCAALALLVVHGAWAGEVRVRVLELFHPKAVTLMAREGGRVSVLARGGNVRLEGAQSYEATLASGAITTEGPVRVRIGDRIERSYPGRMTIESVGDELRLVATLTVEQAVAAIVAAEAGPGAPEEARKAQAIATRSFLLAARGRHSGYGFCDTTHCHHLTAANPAAAEAARTTAGLTLAYGGRVVEALSTRRCGGTTRTLAEIGLDGPSYPYFPAACEPCRRRPSPWARQWPLSDVDELIARPGWESARLDVVRRLGWSAVPSNAYELFVEDGQAKLSGEGEGHGVGLCQFGANELARQGWDAARILRLYFQNTAIRR